MFMCSDDLNRVRLRVLNNDYINASWINVRHIQ